MTNRLKTALDAIQAEPELRENTWVFMRKKILQNRQKSQPGSYWPSKKLSLALSSLAVILLLGLFSFNFYYTASAFVGVESNPAIELQVNRFDRVIGTSAYNAAGLTLLTRLDLQHQDYTQAVERIIEAISAQGYLPDQGLISVTLQTNNPSREKELLTNLEQQVFSTLTAHHIQAQIDIFPVNQETRDCAQDLNLGPAKYTAIQELQAVDPTATIESCENHSIGEIKQMTRAHHGAQEKGEALQASPEQNHHDESTLQSYPQPNSSSNNRPNGTGSNSAGKHVEKHQSNPDKHPNNR